MRVCMCVWALILAGKIFSRYLLTSNAALPGHSRMARERRLGYRIRPLMTFAQLGMGSLGMFAPFADGQDLSLPVS